MKCQFCGKKQSTGVSCSNCGAPLPIPPPPPDSDRQQGKSVHLLAGVLAAVALIILISVVYIFSSPATNITNLLAPKAEHVVVQSLIQKYNSPKSREDWNWTQAFILNFLTIPSDELSDSDYTAVSQFYADCGREGYGLGVLNLARLRTGEDQWFQAMDDMVSVAQFVADNTAMISRDKPKMTETATKLYEKIFGARLETLTWKQLACIKYAKQTDTTFAYSLTSPYDAASTQEFQKTVITIQREELHLSDKWNLQGTLCAPLVGVDDLELTSYRFVTLVGKPIRRLTAQFHAENSQYDMRNMWVMPALEELSATCTEISTAGLEGCAALRKLALSHFHTYGPSGTIRHAFLFSALPDHLEELRLQGFELPEVKSQVLSGANTLKTLALTDCILTADLMMQLPPGLTSLSIQDSPLKTLDFFANLHQLRSLTLTKYGNAFPIDSGDFTHLESLEIDASQSLSVFQEAKGLTALTLVEVHDLKGLTGLDALETLTVTGRMTSINFDHLPILPRLHTIAVLPAGTFGDNHIENLSALAHQPALKTLVLKNLTAGSGLNDILDGGILEELNLTSTTLSMTSTSLANWHSGRSLTICGTRLDNEMGELITAAIAELKDLRYLNLSDTALEDISFISGLKALEVLIAQNNFISDDAVLNQLPALKTWDLSKNMLEEGAAT